MERVYLSSPHMCGEEIKFVNRAFETNWIAPLGENVDAFEVEAAACVGRKFSAALSAGTHAIHLGLKLLGVGAGDYVFCSSLTFSGSCNPVAYEKAIPVFIDCEKDTWNMSADALKKAFVWAKKNNKMPKAVIIVDLYGQSADYDKLIPVCAEYGVPILEDAAEALGADYHGKRCGSFGKLSVLSFNGNKIITTSGGGMLLSDDEADVKKARFWATQARDPALYYLHTEIGFNYRMSNVCAGIGRGQLTVLSERVAKKREIFERYKAAFKNVKDIEMQGCPKGFNHSRWLSVMTLSKGCKTSPADIVNALSSENIECRPVWKPMHTQPVFASCPFFSHIDDKNIESVANDIFARGVCLPSDTKMTAEIQDRVINAVKRCLESHV